MLCDSNKWKPFLFNSIPKWGHLSYSSSSSSSSPPPPPPIQTSPSSSASRKGILISSYQSGGGSTPIRSFDSKSTTPAPSSAIISTSSESPTSTPSPAQASLPPSVPVGPLSSPSEPTWTHSLFRLFALVCG